MISALNKHVQFAPNDIQRLRVAVLVPCYNEAVTIEKVVKDFQSVLPSATVYVYDNNSSDDTIAIAKRLGVVVRSVAQQGKGHVVRRMFADVEADLYVLVDGDATYHAASAPVLISRMLADELDMVVACRESAEETAYRTGHRFGNRLLSACVASIFGNQFTDILSGYRVFSKRFVKSFPALSAGFETETELTVHALELRMPIAEVTTPYAARPPGSTSKLNTYRDGWRIFETILRLFRTERPLAFFGYIGFAFVTLALLLALPLLATYLETGLVPRFPTAILATGLMLTAMLSFVCGLVLDTVTRARHEIKRLAYLSYLVIRWPD
jgi:glycosyltransferase involved in cell wall biosynthesis